MWTPELDAKLLRLWPNHSAAEVAEQLGDGITRNAVIGRYHRLLGKYRGYKRPTEERREYRAEAKCEREQSIKIALKVGVSQSVVARSLGVSRQRVHQIIVDLGSKA